MRRAHAMALKLFFDGLGDCLQLRMALPRAQRKVLSKGHVGRKFQHRNIRRLLFLGRRDSPLNFGTKGFEVHRYRACPRMYSSTCAGTSPCTVALRSSRARTSVDETWLATVVSMCIDVLRSTILSASSRAVRPSFSGGTTSRSASMR